MTPDALRKMYGPIGKGTAPTPIIDKNPNRVAGGIKAAGVHTVTLEKDGRVFAVATERYVKALEEQIRLLRSELLKQNGKINQLVREVNKRNDDLKDLQRKLGEL